MKNKMAEELVKIAKDLIAKDDKVFFVKQGNTYTLWVAYSPGSGTTAIFNGKIKGYITDKQGEENYDSIVRNIARALPENKIIEVGIYDYSTKWNYGDEKDYDIFGGNVKPRKKIYMIVSKQKYIVVSFFDTKAEAKYWIKHSE